jgi:hypothetical protein
VPPDPDALQATLIEANRLWSRVHVTATLGMLPWLLGGLEAAARDGQERSLRLLGQGYGFTSTVMTRCAEHDLAWVAVDRSRTIADRIGDPATQAHAAFRLVHVLLGAGRLEEAAAVADAALARAERDSGSARVRSLQGAIHLPMAVAAARRADEASALAALEEARQLASDVPRDVTFWTGFKPVNVDLHRVSVAVDLGNASEALRVAETIDLDAVREERRSRHLIDVALAHSYRRDTDAMVATLLDIERFAPEALANFPMVREMVHGALRRERGRPSPELHGLALRVGVA